MMLVRAYMTHGHMLADIDPLKLYEAYSSKHPNFAVKFKLPQTSVNNLLDYKSYGFSEADLEKDFYVDLPELGELIGALKNAYCGKIGVEYMHISSREKQHWIREKFEGLQYTSDPKEYRVLNYDRLVWANEF